MNTDVFRLAGVAIIAVCLLGALKKRVPELQIPAQLAAIVCAVALILPYVSGLFEDFNRLARFSDSGYAYTGVLLKGAVISVIGSFVCDICRDNGETAIAGAVDIGVKAIVLSLALPAVEILLGLALNMLN